MDDPDLVISEIFGPTFQGEGPSLGRRCGFVRLGRCDLACSWCDTPYTWDWTRHDPAIELTRLGADAVIDQVRAMNVDRVVVTGGEPLIQQRALVPLLDRFAALGWATEIETAGHHAPTFDPALVDRFNVSPKLAHSGNAEERRYQPDALRAFQASGRASFKFVVAEPSDLDEVADIVEACGLTDIWIMPEGIDAEALAHRSSVLAEAVLGRGWNLTTRLHVLVWGDRRGV
ncbi:MAG: 7-carboxy-7-deazaguanine synthase QueE [Acidimicrobiales bacterium]